MGSVTTEEFSKYKGALFRHYLDSADSEAHKGLNNDIERIKTQKQFINSYFNRFIKTGGTSRDHYDMKRMKRDSYEIPQDISKRYFVMPQLIDNAIPSFVSHVPEWLVRHFQYAVQLSLEYLNEMKFKKMKDLRKSQKELPIYAHKDEVLHLLENNQVLIIAGDTGCGKSTQVPQYLLQAGYSGIACTQPRRIACTALARRVAYETLNAFGNEVAYQIRFETTKGKKTKMLFLTEGLLLRQMEMNSLLEQYNILILDEVHERHLTSDLLIGLLSELVKTRSDLKLILMSATINLDLFSNYFEGAPVIKVPGRLFPIELKYHPIKQFLADTAKKDHKIDPTPFLRILELIDKEVPSTERGDALIFLNGVSEMTTVAESLKTYAEISKGWIILLLHSTLSVEEQDKVFDVAPPGIRKCILSTNIAETSVTIDGIRFVIDSGKVNLIKHEPGSGSQKLTEFWVSKASANQRKGRAGRTGPGICYRLYSSEQFEKMDDFTTPEIHRVSLEEMALRMISLNLGLDPRTFPYIEHPQDEALNIALETLKFQGIVYADRENQLTALGNAIAKLPVDVSIGKMLIMGCVLDQTDVMLTVAASLSVQSPFTHRSFRESNVVERRSTLTSPMGDPFTCINVFREWVEEKVTGGKTRRWAIENGIDEHRLYEISKLRNQYRRVLEDAGLIEKPTAEELGELDSRQRRIDEGEKKKLFAMKRDARNAEKSQKTLKANKHFDSILEDKEEEDLEREQSVLKVDVNTVEFLLSHKQRDVEFIRKTHRLRRKDADLIRFIIAVGLYPNYASLDPHNKYRQGQELFVHTRRKPFSLIHPNSSVAQYHSESLDAHSDASGVSTLHQISFYGLHLETTKPYICNIMPLPVLSLLLVSKKVICDEWKDIVLDDFIETQLEKEVDCKDVLRYTREIRRELNRAMNARLKGLEYDSKYLLRGLRKFFCKVEEEGIKMSCKRLVNPAEKLEGQGFFQPDGKVQLEDDVDDDDEEPVVEELDEDEQVRLAMAVDPLCPTTRAVCDDEEEEEKKVKPVKQETYYEKLLRRQRERETEQGTQEEKRIRLEE
ncbi:unnamed protein product [Auanema sp. JU1783]|nr:unnamed protein product [Auanema sp. JU1783]